MLSQSCVEGVILTLAMILSLHACLTTLIPYIESEAVGEGIIWNLQTPLITTYVTRFAKIDHVRAYCIMRNTNLKY